MYYGLAFFVGAMGSYAFMPTVDSLGNLQHALLAGAASAVLYWAMGDWINN